jgi:O-antigen/teichoic acid export membrane protein
MANPLQSGQIAAGAAWMVLFKVVDRCVGLISTVILARLLVPADFGLIALATALIAMLELLGAFGLDTALIQRSDARREHFDAAWTFHVLFGLGTGVAVAGLAWPVAWLYGDSRLVLVMLMLGLARTVAGFENVGVVAFRKEMAFDKEFLFLVAKRLATTVLVTIPLAFALRSYWALLAGTLAGTCIAVALSYALHPYRPRPSLAALGELMAFSKWLFVTSLVEFLHSRVADLIVGRWAGTAALGSFAIAREVARVPTRELAAPVHRAVFPAYVKLAEDRALLRRQYLKVTSFLLLLIVPAGIGLSLLAEPVILILLGSKWRDAVPLVQVLSINGVLMVFMSTAHHANLAVGMSRLTSLVLAAHAGIAIPLMLWWVPSHGTQGAVAAILTASVVTAPLNFHLLGKAIELGRRELLDILWRPCTGCLGMIVAVLGIKASWAMPADLFGQIAYVLLVSASGALVYAATVFVLWRRKSDPESAEAWALDRIAKFAAAASDRFATRLR